MTYYQIQVHGKFHRYASLEQAKAVAADIFRISGIVVGIEEIKS